jgi:hypothetical protein
LRQEIQNLGVPSRPLDNYLDSGRKARFETERGDTHERSLAALFLAVRWLPIIRTAVAINTSSELLISGTCDRWRGLRFFEPVMTDL